MYRRIILTLDRSALAEQALPHAAALAKAFRAEIELVSVVPLPDSPGPGFGGHVDREAQAAEDREYLAGVASRLEEDSVVTVIRVLRGEVASEILRHAIESEADLIVMSSHGRSGLGRWVYGSIADRVLRHATVPVLLVRATQE